MTEWYYTLDGKQQGPIPQDQLQSMLQSGKLDVASTKVWRVGFGEWADAGSVQELAVPTPSQPEPPETEPGSQPYQNPYAAPTAVETIQTPNTSVLEIPETPATPDLGEIISISWAHLRRQMSVLVVATLVYALLDAATDFVFGLIQTSIDGSSSSFGFESALNWNQSQMYDFGAGSLIVLVLSTFVGMFFKLGYVWIILGALRGRPIEIGDLFSQSHNVLKSVGASIVYGICFALLSLLLIVPGIWIAIRLSFYQEAILEKNLGPIEALKYSYELTRGSSLSLFAIIVVGFVIFILGLLLCLIGGLWTYPLFSLMISGSFLYLHGGPHFIVDPDRIR